MNIINPKPLIQNLLKIKQRPKFSRKTNPYEDLKEKLYAVDEVKKVKKEKWPDISPTIIKWIKDTKKLTKIGKADKNYKIRHTLNDTIKDIAKDVKRACWAQDRDTNTMRRLCKGASIWIYHFLVFEKDFRKVWWVQRTW